MYSYTTSLYLMSLTVKKKVGWNAHGPRGSGGRGYKKSGTFGRVRKREGSVYKSADSCKG